MTESYLLTLEAIIDTRDPEKLNEVVKTIELVVRGILQECDDAAVFSYMMREAKLKEEASE